jgi:hypothetical protein
VGLAVDAVQVDGIVVVWNDLAGGILLTVGEKQLRC